MKNNSKIITIILITIILILSGYIVYNKVLNNNNNQQENSNVDNKTNNNLEDTSTYQDYKEEYNGYIIDYKFTKNDNYNSTTNILNKFAIISYKELNIEKQLLIIDEGKLYYSTDKNLYENGMSQFTDEYQNNNKLEEYDKLSNIKSIKIFNTSTGVSYDIVLITNDGKVYIINYDEQGNLKNPVQVEELSKYEIDDVKQLKMTIPAGYQYEVILQDGTTLTKTINYS